MKFFQTLIALILLAPALAISSTASADDYAYALMNTSDGDIVLQLNKTKAPISVANFEMYANEGYYNGTVFHRVISNFMIQGGGFDHHGNYPTTLHQKPGAKSPIKNEWTNGLKNNRGTIAMARTSAPDSATNQFFINVVDNPALDQPRGGAAYAVFGKVIAGMDAVDRIKAVPTTRLPNGLSDVPSRPVMINSVKIVSKAEAYKSLVAAAEARVKALEAEVVAAKAALEEARKTAEANK